MRAVNVHAVAVLLGEKGLLLRGRSGAGKSALALALLERFRLKGDFAALVADDRVLVDACAGRLIARPHPALAGMIEARGLGILNLRYERACRLHAIVDVSAPGETPPRLPQEGEKTAELAGVALPRVVAAGCDDVSVARIALFLQGITTN
jgi:serine kinase of HPr protein (carbohydrate metabolism regulator)